MSDDWKPTHRHYKGGLYRVICCAKHTETEETLVIYDTKDGEIWARPLAMFQEQVPHPAAFSHAGETVPRFAEVA